MRTRHDFNYSLTVVPQIIRATQNSTVSTSDGRCHTTEHDHRLAECSWRTLALPSVRHDAATLGRVSRIALTIITDGETVRQSGDEPCRTRFVLNHSVQVNLRAVAASWYKLSATTNADHNPRYRSLALFPARHRSARRQNRHRGPHNHGTGNGRSTCRNTESTRRRAGRTRSAGHASLDGNQAVQPPVTVSRRGIGMARAGDDICTPAAAARLVAVARHIRGWQRYAVDDLGNAKLQTC